jgi:aryl-alcohol dehydrogenase-like predicted oxidoreductase
MLMLALISKGERADLSQAERNELRGIEDPILPARRELGIAVTAYGVLSRGPISGNWSPDRSLKGDARSRMPRFAAANLERNLALVELLRAIADTKRVSVVQIAIAWVAAQGDDIVPLVGARRRDQLMQALGALDVTLTEDDLAQIESALPKGAAAGDRHAPQMMAHLDSETGH